MKHTPLYEQHMQSAQKVINLKGFARPIEYNGHSLEHRTTCEQVTICDVSHMGQIEFNGPDAAKLVQKIMTSDADKLPVNRAVYSVMCNEKGGVIDDFICYKLGEDYFLWVVNVTKTDEDFQWIRKHAEGMDVDIRNVTCETAMIAVQGPNSRETLQKITEVDLSEIPYFGVKETKIYAQGLEIPSIISRTGYTGLRGYEILAPRAYASFIWDELLKIGKPLGIMPHGVAARESLRVEAGLLLNGNDININLNPYEVGLGWVVKTDTDFIGRDELVKVKEKGIGKKLIGFEIKGKETARHGNPIFIGEEEIGNVTSGTMVYYPTKRSVGRAVVPIEYSTIGTEFEIEIMNSRFKAVVVESPFRKHSSNDELKEKTHTPVKLKYNDSHLWAYHEGDNILTIGISDFGQRDLGETFYINLPEEGSKIEKNSNLFWLDTYRKTIEFKSPFSGEIVKVDKEVIAEPGRINKYPYSINGVIQIKVENLDDYNSMISFENYNNYIQHLQSYSEWSTNVRTT